MLEKPIKEIKYGSEVFSNKRMEELRKEECLCINCSKLKKCPIAQKLYDTCIENNVALILTRCPKWEA